MCLEKLKDYEVKKKTGYKLIWGGRTNYKGAITSLMNLRLPFDKWVTDKEKRPITEREITYPTGFHVYLTKKGAKSWHTGNDRTKIVKVDFDDVVATGYQAGFYDRGLYKVIVARKIYIHKP